MSRTRTACRRPGRRQDDAQPAQKFQKLLTPFILFQVDEILAAEGAELWCVVNNAACLVFGEAEWQTPGQIKRQLAVNAAGPLLVAKAFLPLLRRRAMAGRFPIMPKALTNFFWHHQGPEAGSSTSRATPPESRSHSSRVNQPVLVAKCCIAATALQICRHAYFF